MNGCKDLSSVLRFRLPRTVSMLLGIFPAVLSFAAELACDDHMDIDVSLLTHLYLSGLLCLRKGV